MITINLASCDDFKPGACLQQGGGFLKLFCTYMHGITLIVLVLPQGYY